MPTKQPPPSQQRLGGEPSAVRAHATSLGVRPALSSSEVISGLLMSLMLLSPHHGAPACRPELHPGHRWRHQPILRCSDPTRRRSSPTCESSLSSSSSSLPDRFCSDDHLLLPRLCPPRPTQPQGAETTPASRPQASYLVNLAQLQQQHQASNGGPPPPPAGPLPQPPRPPVANTSASGAPTSLHSASGFVHIPGRSRQASGTGSVGNAASQGGAAASPLTADALAAHQQRHGLGAAAPPGAAAAAAAPLASPDGARRAASGSRGAGGGGRSVEVGHETSRTSSQVWVRERVVG